MYLLYTKSARIVIFFMYVLWNMKIYQMYVVIIILMWYMLNILVTIFCI